MMTNKEMNAAIKNELKEAGYNTRDFSISVKDCGYSTAIRIKIKSPEVNREDIETLLNHWNAVEHDAQTYEVLEGCNTYLFIDYADGIFDEPAQQYAANARGAFMSQDETTKIFDGLYLINWEHKGRLEIRQQNTKGNCTLKVYDFNALCVFIYKFAKFGYIAA